MSGWRSSFKGEDCCVFVVELFVGGGGDGRCSDETERERERAVFCPSEAHSTSSFTIDIPQSHIEFSQ